MVCRQVLDVEAAARVQAQSAGPTYVRRQPEKTAPFRVMQEHLLTFEQQWTDQASGRTLPKFVTGELPRYLDCGILGRGFAHLHCESCGEHHVVAFSCKARAACPSCLGTVVVDEAMAEKEPLLAKLLAAATSGTDVAGSADRRREIRVVLDPDERPVGKGTLCGQSHGFNLQNATRVAANDKDGRERPCRYILRPPLANDWLKLLDDGHARLDLGTGIQNERLRRAMDLRLVRPDAGIAGGVGRSLMGSPGGGRRVRLGSIRATAHASGIRRRMRP